MSEGVSKQQLHCARKMPSKSVPFPEFPAVNRQTKMKTGPERSGKKVKIWGKVEGQMQHADTKCQKDN
ncbi:hypothetical protein [Deinococcus misasensis]|uniref:hypothetical protein n=1 Tax=Deinococcus misasensis TaxID=392413 RepID=UPI000554A314|nr:hypothetical protein [Deinococcus misasensis]